MKIAPKYFAQNILCICIILIGIFSPANAKKPPEPKDRVFLTQEVALERIFASSERIEVERHRLTSAQVAQVEKVTKRELSRDTFVFHVGYTGDQVDGYVFIDDQTGKFHPITFLAAITPSGEVSQVEVLIYRESIGDGVRHSRFLKQFNGKTIDDVPRLKRKIRYVTGATISSRSMMRGVGRAVALWNVIYGADNIRWIYHGPHSLRSRDTSE